MKKTLKTLAWTLGVVVLAVSGASVGWYGVLLAVAPLVAVLLAAPGWTPLTSRGAALVPWRPILSDLLGLLAGSYLAIVLFNVGPLIVLFVSLLEKPAARAARDSSANLEEIWNSKAYGRSAGSRSGRAVVRSLGCIRSLETARTQSRSPRFQT